MHDDLHLSEKLLGAGLPLCDRELAVRAAEPLCTDPIGSDLLSRLNRLAEGLSVPAHPQNQPL